jgi:hypothetical protein
LRRHCRPSRQRARVLESTAWVLFFPGEILSPLQSSCLATMSLLLSRQKNRPSLHHSPRTPVNRAALPWYGCLHLCPSVPLPPPPPFSLSPRHPGGSDCIGGGGRWGTPRRASLSSSGGECWSDVAAGRACGGSGGGPTGGVRGGQRRRRGRGSGPDNKDKAGARAVSANGRAAHDGNGGNYDNGEDNYDYNDDIDDYVDINVRGCGRDAGGRFALGPAFQPTASAAARGGPPSLSTMFAPPLHFVHWGGGFLGARSERPEQG